MDVSISNVNDILRTQLICVSKLLISTSLPDRITYTDKEDHYPKYSENISRTVFR